MSWLNMPTDHRGYTELKILVESELGPSSYTTSLRDEFALLQTSRSFSTVL